MTTQSGRHHQPAQSRVLERLHVLICETTTRVGCLGVALEDRPNARCALDERALVNSQHPTSNHQPLPTAKRQLPATSNPIGNWAMGVVGRWELGIGG